MKPSIDNTEFGSITIEKKEYDYDVIITSEGEVNKRKKNCQKSFMERLINFQRMK